MHSRIAKLRPYYDGVRRLRCRVGFDYRSTRRPLNECVGRTIKGIVIMRYHAIECLDSRLHLI